MKKLLAVFVFLGSCSAPVPAAEQYSDGSIKLSPQEVENTTRNFAYLLELVKKLQEKVTGLEAEKQCKGV